jgi:hypothetical protein
MHRAAPAIAALAIVLAAVLPAPAAAAGPAPESSAPVVVADLDGTAIPVSSIPGHHCHDWAFPAIHCFATADARNRSLVDAEGSNKAGAVGVAATSYAIVFGGTSYGGASMTISQDYDTLVVVGWNDRIRSFKGLNSGRGIFWTDWYATGSSLSFCCNVNDPSLPSTFDQQITSVYRQ